jgi:hypothetical protein
MQVLADRYINDNQQEDPVWLHASMDGETGERRALVRSIEIQYKPQWFGAGESTLNIPLALVIEREPYWENPTATSLPDVAPSAAACVVYDYTSGAGQDVVGDAGGRIRLFGIKHTTGLDRYWMGIRSANKHGSTGLSNFINIWECEDGTPGTDVTETADGSASGGTKDRVTESARNWDSGIFFDVCRILLTDVTANEEDQLGDFLWLLRAKVVSGTWEIRLSFAASTSSAELFSEIVEVSNTNWEYYDLAIHPIPVRNLHAILDTDFPTTGETLAVRVYARRTSGSGDLDVDAVIPIPIDEGFIKMQGDTSVGGTEQLYFGHSPEGIKDTMTRIVNSPGQRFAIRGIHNFILPPGDGRIYCVYSQKEGAADVLTDTIVFNDGDVGRYYERWYSLRGGE